MCHRRKRGPIYPHGGEWKVKPTDLLAYRSQQKYQFKTERLRELLCEGRSHLLSPSTEASAPPFDAVKLYRNGETKKVQIQVCRGFFNVITRISFRWGDT